MVLSCTPSKNFKLTLHLRLKYIFFNRKNGIVILGDQTERETNLEIGRVNSKYFITK